MSNTNGSREDCRSDELSPALAAAVEAVLAQPATEASIERALARVAGQFSAGGKNRIEPPRRSLRWLLAAGMAAAVLAAAGVWLWRPSVSWAEVAKALAGKPWIHGVVSAPNGEKREWWSSIERGCFASLHGKQAAFEDLRLHVRTEYDPELGRIVRQIRPDTGMARSFTDLFEGIIRGQAPVGLIVEGQEVISQESRRVVEGDRQWLEYDLTLRVAYDLKANRLSRMRFRVDPQTHLPQSMIVTPLSSSDQADSANHRVEIAFDYPDRGPIDIYDLGAPRTAELIDRVPNDDLQRIIAAVESGRKDFDPYFAVVVQQHGANEPWHTGLPMAIWRKGARWRVEMGGFGEAPPQPEADADRGAWWMQQFRRGKWSPLEVCDGKTVYSAKYSEPDAQGNQTHTWEAARRLNATEGIDVAWAGIASDRFAERYGYPDTLGPPSNLFTVEIDPHPAAGPRASLLIRYRATRELKDGAVYRDCRYWIDPAKDYVTRQYVVGDANEGGVSESDSYTMEDFERSPRGIWYPTIVRRRVTMDPPPAENWNGDTVTRFFLDFEAEIPDELFRPVDRE